MVAQIENREEPSTCRRCWAACFFVGLAHVLGDDRAELRQRRLDEVGGLAADRLVGLGERGDVDLLGGVVGDGHDGGDDLVLVRDEVGAEVGLAAGLEALPLRIEAAGQLRQQAVESLGDDVGVHLLGRADRSLERHAGDSGLAVDGAVDEVGQVGDDGLARGAEKIVERAHGGKPFGDVGERRPVAAAFCPY